MNTSDQALVSRLASRFLTAEARMARLDAIPLTQVVTKYEINHPEYGTWQLLYSDDKGDWILFAVGPSPSTGVPTGKIISEYSLFPRPVKPGHPTERALMEKAEKALVATVAKYSQSGGGAGPARPKVAVGDIMVSSWGYDQTNVDFYQVVKTTKTMVAIRRINKKVVSGQGKPQEKVMPIPNDWHSRGKVLRKKLKEYQGRPYVSLNSYSSAYKWDGRPVSQTGGGYGH